MKKPPPNIESRIYDKCIKRMLRQMQNQASEVLTTCVLEKLETALRPVRHITSMDDYTG